MRASDTLIVAASCPECFGRKRSRPPPALPSPPPHRPLPGARAALLTCPPCLPVPHEPQQGIRPGRPLRGARPLRAQRVRGLRCACRRRGGPLRRPAERVRLPQPLRRQVGCARVVRRLRVVCVCVCVAWVCVCCMAPGGSAAEDPTCWLLAGCWLTAPAPPLRGGGRAVHLSRTVQPCTGRACAWGRLTAPAAVVTCACACRARVPDRLSAYDYPYDDRWVCTSARARVRALGTRAWAASHVPRRQGLLILSLWAGAPLRLFLNLGSTCALQPLDSACAGLWTAARCLGTLWLQRHALSFMWSRIGEQHGVWSVLEQLALEAGQALTHTYGPQRSHKT